MYFLKQNNNQYWDGKEWVEDWRTAKCYGSAATAIKEAPNRTCLATGFTREQWDAHYNSPASEAQPSV